jgi:hypothetical protein
MTTQSPGTWSVHVVVVRVRGVLWVPRRCGVKVHYPYAQMIISNDME